MCADLPWYAKGNRHTSRPAARFGPSLHCLIHPDWTIHEPHDPPAHGREGAVTRWVGRGVHNSELMGIPATRAEIRVDAITIHRIQDGMIIEHTGVWDALALLQQIGVVEAPAAA